MGGVPAFPGAGHTDGVDEAAVPWARDVLRRSGVEPGPAEFVKDRPWSTVWRFSTPTGPVWLKACPERTRHEVRLLSALARWGVPHVLVPLAVEEDRGWVLLPDGGPTVRDVPLEPVAAQRRWAGALSAYGEVQRATAAHADDLVALGVPDLRLPQLPTAFERLALRWAPDVRPLLARVREEAAELADLGLPATLQHDDLHDGNVFAAGNVPSTGATRASGTPSRACSWPSTPGRRVRLPIRASPRRRPTSRAGQGSRRMVSTASSSSPCAWPSSAAPTAGTGPWRAGRTRPSPTDRAGGLVAPTRLRVGRGGLACSG